MIENYLKIAWRNLVRNKFYSTINIVGLSVGIAGCILIFLYVQDELSYDKHNTRAHNIYRLTEELHLPKEDRQQAATSPRMANDMKSNFPEVLKTTRISFSSRILSYRQKKLFDTKIMYADSTFPGIFSVELIQGNEQTMLSDPYSVVLTESAAKKYFGNEAAIGKTMSFSDTVNLTVTGIVKDIPKTSHLTFDCVISRNTIDEMNKNVPEYVEEMKTAWFYNNLYTYLLLAEGTDPKALEQKINKYIHKEMAEIRKSSGMYYDFHLQPLTDIHLKSNYKAELSPNNNSSITYVYIFSGAAILILLIACSNFINLSTAKSANRSKEIGLRKVIGAERKQLIFQFLGESFLLTLIASIASVVLIMIVLPSFNSFSGKSLHLNFFSNRTLVLIYGSIIFVAGLLAGTYPALMMSSFAPVVSLKGRIRHSWQDILMRKGLVVFQFSIAIVLIVGTFLVLQQLKYMQNKDIGLKKDQVMQIELKPGDEEHMDVITKNLHNINGVENVSFSSFSFKNGTASIAVLPEGTSENELTSQCVIAADYDFLQTFQIRLASGRNFSRSFATDPNEAFIINETAAKEFGWGDATKAIGKGLDWGLGKKGKVIGVVKDFNFKTLHDKITPMIMHIIPDWYQVVSIRVKGENMPATLSAIEKTWKGFNPDQPFTYTFLDDDFAAFYKAEENMQFILSVFSILSVFIACLGLFGLAAYTIKQRFREIGIRKVLGASVNSLVTLLSKDFLKLVLIAILVSTPVAWFAMHSWLSSFAFHISISPMVFVLSGAITVLVAILTICIQAGKAALSNPTQSLKSE